MVVSIGGGGGARGSEVQVIKGGWVGWDLGTLGARSSSSGGGDGFIVSNRGGQLPCKGCGDVGNGGILRSLVQVACRLVGSFEGGEGVACLVAIEAGGVRERTTRVRCRQRGFVGLYYILGSRVALFGWPLTMIVL